jgi:hypothetical protein
MGRRNLFAGRRNGSRAAQIVTESPGEQRPTTETADAACEEVIETPRASAKPGWLLRRPMRTADPSGTFRKNQNWNRSTQVLILEASRRSVNCNGRNCGRSGVIGGPGGRQKKSALPFRKRQWEKALWTRKATRGDVPQARLVLSRMLKNRASRRDPALCGYCKCSHLAEYAALFKTPHALADGLMLVFQHPVSAGRSESVCRPGGCRVS